MNRKHFLRSALPLAGVLSSFKNMQNLRPAGIGSIAPVLAPYLKKNDSIGIVCPAGFITREEIQPAINKMTEWGFNIKIGNTVGKRDFTFGGTDDERAADLQQMLDDKNIKAIMCARGGYGSMRIIDKLDFKKFEASPKWIIGFSDVTVIHQHVQQNYNIAGIHSKMCNSFPDDWTNAEQVQRDSIESIRKCLTGEKMFYSAPPNPKNKTGICSGVLTGGNLKTIESLHGSRSSIATGNKILFLEDTGEYLYSIDRMFWSLKRAGKLSALKGLVVGGFKVKPDDAGEEFGRSVEDIILEKLQEYNYPVCFDFPVGHQKNNVALKCGVVHSLNVSDDGAVLSD